MLVDSFSSRSHGIDNDLVHVGIMVDKVALIQIFFRVLSILSLSCNQSSIFILYSFTAEVASH